MSQFIAVLMGSDSDLPTMQSCLDVLKSFDINHEVKITSAHRTPIETQQYVIDAEKRGCQVFICAAGMAAHLAGAVAAHSLKPVIGVPMNASLDGLDSLLSTAQMPAGIPVATVAIGKAGAKNAAFLAAQILAISDANLFKKVISQRKEAANEVIKKDHNLQQNL